MALQLPGGIDATAHPNEPKREDDYEVVRQIGSGSFGDVFLVKNTKERKEYVVKTIALLSTMRSQGRESLEQEVALLIQMRHPNIVAYKDHLINRDGYLCIYMEYCEHGDVFTFLREQKKLHKPTVEHRLLEWFIQIILALHALHTKRILHRDLKTQNIFLTGSRVQNVFALKLGDFGIAKVLDSNEDFARTQIGTPFYMSPELINNKPYSYKSDIWGLGCVLYEIINGRQAFEAQSLNGLALKIMKGRYTPITASCSEDTKNLIVSMLRTSPSDRPKLEDLLHAKSMRNRIRIAAQSVVEFGVPEAKAFAEEVLTEQLNSLGFGDILDAPRRDVGKLRKKLEKKQEKLQEMERKQDQLMATIQVLASNLKPGGEEKKSSAGLSSVDEAIHPAPDDWGEANVTDLTPAATSRSLEENRPLPQRDRKSSRDRGPQKDVEALPVPGSGGRGRHIRGLHEHDHDRASKARLASHNELATQEPKVRRRRACTEDPGRRRTYTHECAAPSLVTPSHTARSNGTPRAAPRRRADSLDPRPPPKGYREPSPPQAAPAPGNHGSWKSAALERHGSNPMYTSRSSLKLEPLRDPAQEEWASSSASCSDEDDRFSDLGVGQALRPVTSEEVRHQAQALEHKRASYEAAICRHRMTIETLRHKVSQEHAHEAAVEGSPHGGHRHDPDDALSSDHRLQGVSPPSSKQKRRMPAVVKDQIAMLLRKCLDGIGQDKLDQAKRCLNVLLDGREQATNCRRHMLETLGGDKIGFYALIDQIVYLERTWGCEQEDLT